MMAITINSSMRVNVDRHGRFNGVSRYFTDTSLHESVTRDFPLPSTRFGGDKLAAPGVPACRRSREERKQLAGCRPPRRYGKASSISVFAAVATVRPVSVLPVIGRLPCIYYSRFLNLRHRRRPADAALQRRPGKAERRAPPPAPPRACRTNYKLPVFLSILTGSP